MGDTVLNCLSNQGYITNSLQLAAIGITILRGLLNIPAFHQYCQTLLVKDSGPAPPTILFRSHADDRSGLVHSTNLFRSHAEGRVWTRASHEFVQKPRRRPTLGPHRPRFCSEATQTTRRKRNRVITTHRCDCYQRHARFGNVIVSSQLFAVTAANNMLALET